MNTAHNQEKVEKNEIESLRELQRETMRRLEAKRQRAETRESELESGFLEAARLWKKEDFAGAAEIGLYINRKMRANQEIDFEIRMIGSPQLFERVKIAEAFKEKMDKGRSAHLSDSPHQPKMERPAIIGFACAVFIWFTVLVLHTCNSP